MDALTQYMQLIKYIRSILRKAFDAIETIKYLDFEDSCVDSSKVVYPCLILKIHPLLLASH